VPLPFLSIIVPVYNVDQFLPQCLDSILCQSYGEFQLLLIDDGSKDSSGAICDDYSRKDSRIQVFHQKNGGVSFARNQGLRHASGEWVLFVDGDDWLDKNYLSSFVEQPDLRKEFLFFQGYKKIFSDKIIGFSLFPQTTSSKTIARNNLFLYWGVWGKLFHRETIEKLNLRFDTTLSLGEDTIFLFQYLSAISELKVVPGSGYNYRDSGTSLSKKSIPWEIHCAGSKRIHEVAVPQVKRLLKDEFFYRKNFLNLLIYEQHALRLATLYDGSCARNKRIAALKETFGNRGRLLKTAYPAFSRKWKYSVLWFMFLCLPVSACDWILQYVFSDGRNK
jgi:glycosyltransferase involved in cell wall biosynthesis